MVKMSNEIKNHVDDSESGNLDMQVLDSDSDSGESEVGDGSSLGADSGSESSEHEALTETITETWNESTGRSSTQKTQKGVKASQRKRFTVVDKVGVASQLDRKLGRTLTDCSNSSMQL